MAEVSKQEVVRAYLQSQRTAIWGRSFDLLNNIDSATEFVVELWDDLEAEAFDHEANDSR